MNDDELIDRLQRTLHEQASHVHAPPDAWDRFQGCAKGAAAPSPRSRWLIAAPVAAVGLAAAIVAAVVVTTTSTHSSSRTQLATTAAGTPAPAAAGAAPAAGTGAGPATTAAASATTAPPAASAAAAPAPSGQVPAGFTIRSVSFVSATEGFALGASAIAHTLDAGRTWTALPAPPTTNVSELRFANAEDGWAWGPDLWVTHDGARTWHQLIVPGGEGRVYDLEASAGTVHMAVFDGQAFRVATAPVGSDSFSLSLGSPSVPAGAGPVPTVQLVLQGRTGWMIEVDRTVIGGLRLVNGTWQPWTPPCIGSNGPAVLSASSPTELVAVCDQGVWGPATPMGQRLWVSHDGGATFTDVGAAPGANVGGVASASPTTVVVASPTDALHATFDGGGTWVAVLPIAASAVADLGFTTATQGVVVAGGELEMTRDGGHTWQQVAFP
jgi:hypothetical protein